MKLKEITYRLYFVALSILAIVATVACGSNEAEMLPDEPTYTISLQLNTNGIFTRAENWGSEYTKEEGTPFDKTIKSVDLFLLNTDNTIAARLYALKDQDKSNQDAHIYTCSVTKDTPGVIIDEKNRTATFSGRIMVMANMMSPWYEASNWQSGMIPFNVGFGIIDNWYIPMWGINTYENVEIKDKELRQLDDIDLLRAVSKIDIKLHDDIKNDFEIESVTMAQDSPKLYGNGFGLPTGALGVTSTRALELEGCFNPVSDDVAIVRLENPVFSLSANKDEVVTYVAESKTDENKPFKFTLKLKSKYSTERPDITGTLYLSEYQDGKREENGTYTEIIRNHVYEFTVNLTELGFLTTVEKWIPGGEEYIDM